MFSRNLFCNSLDSNLCKDTLDNLQITDYSSPLNISSVVVPESMVNAF